MLPSLLDAPVPVTWVLARPLTNGHFEFFAGYSVTRAISLTPAFYLARRFPTARAAYEFAGQRHDLQEFVVTRRGKRAGRRA